MSELVKLFQNPLVVPLCTFLYHFEHADGQAVSLNWQRYVNHSVYRCTFCTFCASFEHARGQPKDFEHARGQPKDLVSLESLKRVFGFCTLLIGC